MGLGKFIRIPSQINMTVNKKIDPTDGFAVTVCHVIMSNNVSTFFSKFEEGGKNRVVPHSGKLCSFYGFSCKKKRYVTQNGIRTSDHWMQV